MPLRKAGPAAVVAALACGSLLMAQDPADSHLTLRISAGRITVGTSQRDSEALRDDGAGQAVVLACREFRLSAASKKAAILECVDVVFVTASGVEGRAKRLRYDSGKQRITLSGSDEQAVELIHEPDGEDRPSTRLSAQHVAIDLEHLRIMAEGTRAVVECQSKPAMLAPPGASAGDDSDEITGIKKVRITKAYWFLSSERPASIPEESVKKNEDGHVLVHVEASFQELEAVYPRLQKAFLLTAEGHAPVPLRAERGYWSSECYLRIPRAAYARMKPGIPYRLEPAGTDGEYQWVVADGVVLVKSAQPPDAQDESAESGRVEGPDAS